MVYTMKDVSHHPDRIARISQLNIFKTGNPLCNKKNLLKRIDRLTHQRILDQAENESQKER